MGRAEKTCETRPICLLKKGESSDMIERLVTVTCLTRITYLPEQESAHS
jgi:hypothetical protein